MLKMKLTLLLFNKMETQLEKLKTIEQPVGYTKEGHPIILALRVENQAKFYCVNCKKFHTHGYMSGCRYSHCFNKDISFRFFYLLVVESLDDINKVLKGGEFKSGT